MLFDEFDDNGSIASEDSHSDDEYLNTNIDLMEGADEIPYIINDVLGNVDPLTVQIVQPAIGDGCTDHIEDNTRYQIDTFYQWMTTTLGLLNFKWDKFTEPCPVLGLLAVLEISGTDKNGVVGTTSIVGCGHSLSQLIRIRKFVSRLNEENGFSIRKLYPDDHEHVYLRGEPMNSAHHKFIVRCMKKFTKKISRREIQAQPFLRHHLLIVRKDLLQQGSFGFMIYTGILISFWLALRIGTLLTIRIENIEIGTDSLTKCGLPQYLKVNIRMQKNSTNYKLFRLWSYSDDDIEVCPVFHLCLWLKMTSWVSGYVFRRPLTGTQDGSHVFNYSQCDHVPRTLFWSVYKKAFSKVFFNTEYKCSLHGPRRSQAQLMDRTGFSLVHIMAQCLWKHAQDAMRYIASSRVELELLPPEHQREFPKPKPVHP
jgi:hypothetical protein